MLGDALGHFGGAAVGVLAHALGSNGYADIDGSGNDLIGDVLNGQETGGAESVGDGGCCCYGVACCQHGGAGDVCRARAEHVADADIFNKVGV